MRIILNRSLPFALLLTLVIILSSDSRLLAQSSTSVEFAPYTLDFVPTSPKEAWRDLEAVQINDGTPWWKEVLYYIPNRVLDLIDVFRIDLGIGGSLGGVIRVTKYAQVGYRQMIPASFRVGDFGREFPVLIESSNELGLSPAFKQSADRDVGDAELGVGADLVLVGAYGGIRLDELVDLLGGIFLIDIKDDDL
jgi:hypothetical protein